MNRREFEQVQWSSVLEADLRNLLSLALAEDLGQDGDLTTIALVPEEVAGKAAVVARESGVVAGIACLPVTLRTVDPRLAWVGLLEDGVTVEPGDSLGYIEGPARSMLTAERIALNIVGRLSGIASQTRSYAVAVSHTAAKIYDTRKTTPGWRRLEKYAVRCGGGQNHRTGLHEAVLIKDNHLAFGAESAARAGRPYSPAEAVITAREYLATHGLPSRIVEIEVDTLEQLGDVLATGPDLVLLDNMGPEVLRQAVARRDAEAPAVQLEASGGINMTTVRAIAESGVDRISVGALTHSVTCLDVGLDWLNH